MRLEDVTAEIRPRTDWEAVDLGFAMARRDFWRCFVVWWLALLVPLGLAGWLLKDIPLLLVPLLWWVKPAGARMVLFELSRRLFGESPDWKSVFRQLPGAWFRRFFYRFCWARFSPWLPVMLAVEDLEGLRGKAYRRRASQLALRGDGVVMWVFLLADLAAFWVALSVFVFGAMLMPEGQGVAWQVAAETFDMSRPQDIPAVISWTTVACFAIGISLTDLFVIGAGFGIYVNNRTWLEGWDVELAFKRLGKRLAKFSAVAVIFLSFCMPAISRAQDEADDSFPTDAEVIREVKADKDFKVYERVDRIPKNKSSWKWPNLSGMGKFAVVLGYAALGLLLAFIVWLIWRYRHVFVLKASRGSKASPKAAPEVRVVMGMEVSADTLPKDIPGRVMALWGEGRHHEALALLYRGTISKVIDQSRVDIQESDTEGDCLKRVEAAGSPAHPGYFRGLTNAWMGLAYAGMTPREGEVETLCREWPFMDRRGA